MFKPVGNLMVKTPWWILVCGGVATLLVLIVFALPIQVMRLHQSGGTPQESRAIEREISLAFGHRALNFAADVVQALRARTEDNTRQQELEYALIEIDRAKKELAAAQTEIGGTAREIARESSDKALDVAQDVAQHASKAIAPTAPNRSSTAAASSAIPSPVPPANPVTSPPFSPVAGIHGPGDTEIQPLPDGFRGEIQRKVDGDMGRIVVGSVLILAFIPLFVVVLVSKYFLGRSRQALAVAEEKTQAAQSSDMSRQITEARLQALQAQVEPHFLYNTLANVQALTEVDPPAANLMVSHLIQYLRASLPKMRENTSTVGQELELVRAYLNILQMRMGNRLDFSVSAPDDLLSKSFPPMMLPSLVENAIKHGLEPLREGGRIDVLVQRIVTPLGDRIVIEVRDTGKGLVADATQPGGGVGLSNLRERLAAIYGHNARFTLESNVPKGVVTTIDIPTEAPSAPGTVMGTLHKVAPPLVQMPETGWRKAVHFTTKSHSVWALVVSRTFIVLMVTLCAAFLLALISLYTGWMPVQVGNFQLDGVEGMALGSVGLLVAFGALALAILVVVAVLYGLGFLFAVLLVFIPAMVLISLFPVMFPFILIALAIYGFSKKRGKGQSGPPA